MRLVVPAVVVRLDAPTRLAETVPPMEFTAVVILPFWIVPDCSATLLIDCDVPPRSRTPPAPMVVCEPPLNLPAPLTVSVLPVTKVAPV